MRTRDISLKDENFCATAGESSQGVSQGNIAEKAGGCTAIGVCARFAHEFHMYSFHTYAHSTGMPQMHV